LALVLIALLAWKVGDQTSAIIALTVVGGILGFLRYNTFPARIFMGDSGSQFLGFITACLAVTITQSESSALNPFLPVLILGIPIMDIVQVICVRIKKGLPLPGPDKEHFHHQLVKLSFQHYEVVAIIYVLQLILMSAAFLLCFENEATLFLFYASYFAVVIGAIYIAHSTGWRMRVSGGLEDGRERRNELLRKMDWFYNHSGHMTEVLLAVFYVLVTWLVYPVAGSFQSSALIVAVVLFVCLLFGRQWPALLTRACCYSTSVLLMYLLTQHAAVESIMPIINGYLVAMVLFLVVAIRMTRRAEFSLDTQDLLVLLLVIILPQLPISGLDESAIGSITLQLAVLLYGCEFLLGKDAKNHNVLNVTSILCLLAIGLPLIVGSV
jgi:UDP-GlcNAc:undecaprenyl-phosphate GlcNAc-1-phosphate transferase